MQTLWLKSNKEHKRTSSYLGVSWDAKRNAWWAKLNVNGDMTLVCTQAKFPQHAPTAKWPRSLEGQPM